MTPHRTAHEGRWPLRGFWRAWFWISAGIAGVLAAAGLGVVVLAGWAPAPVLVGLLVAAAPLLAVAGVIGRQLYLTALEVTMSPAGVLRVGLLGRRLTVDAAGVRRVRLSAMVSSHTPVVIETERGNVLLLHPRTEVEEIVAVLRRANPRLAVDL